MPSSPPSFFYVATLLRRFSVRAGPKTGFFAAMVLTALVSPASAESTKFMQVEGFPRLLEGDPKNVALAEDGAITLAPVTRELELDSHTSLGASCLWQGQLVAAQLGASANVVVFDTKGRTRTLWQPKGAAVTRITASGANLWLAQAPNAQLVRLDAKGREQVFDVPGAKYVWDMAPTADGGIYVVTGEPGALLKMDKAGHWETVWTSPETHLKALLVDKDMGIAVGGGERGVVYLATDRRHFRALYDSQTREIVALVALNGSLLAASVTGAQAAITDPSQSQAAAKTEVKSQLVRLSLSGEAELLAGSIDEVIFDVALDANGQVLVATGATGRPNARGRLYRLDPVRRVVSLVHQSDSRRLVRLLQADKSGIFVVGQESTKVTEILASPTSEGSYLTSVADLGVTSRLGLVQALGNFPAGSRAQLEVRSGHTAEPDATWSPWSTPVAAPGDRATDAPAGRFVQLRLKLFGKQAAQPTVWRLRLAYLRQNVAPMVRDIGAMERGIRVTALPAGMGQDDSRAHIAPLFDKTDEATAEALRRAPPRVRQVLETGALTVRWQADDANNDELEYTLWLRPTHVSSWRLVKDHMDNPFYSFAAGQLPDGHYLFRVRASDVRTNPMDQALSDTRESRAILVDNTPPAFVDMVARVKGASVVVTGEVYDNVGPLTALTYSLDAALMRPFSPADGVLDGPREHIHLPLGPMSAGSHTLVIQTKDGAGNEAFAQLSFTTAR